MRFVKEQHQGSEITRQNVLNKVQAERATGTLERWLNRNVRGRLRPTPPHKQVLQVTHTR